jgi:PAS domain-containing protein
MTGCFDGADTTKISPEAVARGVDQIGTLGSGRPGPPCFTTLSDITARKQAEYALRQSEARMRSIVETGVTILADMLREQKMEPDAPC